MSEDILPWKWDSIISCNEQDGRKTFFYFLLAMSALFSSTVFAFTVLHWLVFFFFFFLTTLFSFVPYLLSGTSFYPSVPSWEQRKPSWPKTPVSPFLAVFLSFTFTSVPHSYHQPIMKEQKLLSLNPDNCLYCSIMFIFSYLNMKIL